MTINIAIATYDAIVFGCDSLSSIVEQAVLPFRHGQDGFARDAQGNELIDAFGNRVVSVANVQPFVTNVFGGAQKMFLLYEDDDTSVAAVTAGMATLSGVTIASVAARFRKKMLPKMFIFPLSKRSLKLFSSTQEQNGSGN